MAWFPAAKPEEKDLHAHTIAWDGITQGTDIDAVIELVLREVGLWAEVRDRLHFSALSLSGGQQQRLCIARALALNP